MSSMKFALLAIVACFGCAAATGSETVGMPNPAAVKCIDGGYELEDILTHGVPTGAWCVEPKTGRKCEVWAYWHGECALPPMNKADEKNK